jgi:hypothetical protein
MRAGGKHCHADPERSEGEAAGLRPFSFAALRIRVTLLLFCLFAPTTLSSQIRASELGSVSQVIDGTRISIEYSRPRARGRQDVFGGEVKWQEVWTPGANFATTLELSKGVKIEGYPVPKGKYSVWMVVRPAGDWTLVLDPRPRLYHMAHPDSTPEQIRFPVKALPGPFTEVLTWSFPENRSTGATMVMSWAASRVPLTVTVEPTYRLAMPAAEAAPYVGEYEFRWSDMPDSVRSLGLIVAYRDSMLGMGFEPRDPYYDGAGLIRIKEDWFIPAIFDKGQFVDALKEMVLEFKVVAGKAVSFEVRGDGDELWAKGRRKGR